ncbi:hypothetical protein ABT124_07400 [Streptomyces sp. NPDC001982]|uniref:hypothetical protein n=1 Tax=unclassified Streptomyces TaxID=2593676 RepID=UPI00331CD489
MSHAVLALGVAAVTAAGCVWYLPALADLRAGADRPLSRRSAAAACLSGWATAGLVAVLLLVTESWWIPGATAVAGASGTVGLRISAAARRRREARETARDWAQLHRTPAPARTDRSRNVVAVLAGVGLTTAVVVAFLRLTTAPEDGAHWATAAAAPAMVVGLFLTIAVVHTRTARRRTTPDSTRPRR